MTVAASKSLRVLLLTDENLIPNIPRSKLKGRDAELSKAEYDVLNALKKLGHEVTCAGVGSELAVIRRAIASNKPHIAFNLVEQFDGLPFFDQHVVSYLELRKQKYTGCNPRGLTLARDKAPHSSALRNYPRGIRPDDTGRMGQEAQFRGCSLFSSPQDALQFPIGLTFHYSANRPTLGRSEHQASRPAQ